ncbi:conserved hypothetical protein [Beggiatoa sp. PS]|nr:conserved hypothetical protein [Beggiatoa sp. PS]
MKLELRNSSSGEYEVELIEPHSEQSPIIEQFRIPKNYESCLESLGFLDYTEIRQNNPSSKISVKSNTQILKEDIGIPLFNALFTGKILKSYKKALKASSLTIQLKITAPELLNIPWEYMYDAHVLRNYLLLTLQTKIMLSRLLDVSPEVVDRKKMNRPLRVLVVISQPSNQRNDYPPIVYKAEDKWLEKLSSNKNKKLKIDRVSPASTNQLRNNLTNKHFDILHFFGHGDLDEKETKVF